MSFIRSFSHRALTALGVAAGLSLAAPAEAATELRVGFIPVVGSAQIFVIDGEGWAREAGIALKLTQFESGPAMISALASGTLDAYYGGIGPIMVASAKGVDTKVVAATAVEEMTVVARGDYAATPDAATAAGFKAFAAKAGRPVKIATQPTGSVPDTVLRYWLANTVKADPATYQIVAMGIEQTQQALLAGAVDAATIREPAVTIVLDREPQARLLVLGGQMMKDQPGSVVAVTGAAVAADRAAIEKLVALHVRATKLLKDNPDGAAAHLQKGLGKGITDISVFQKAVTSPASRFVADPNQIKAATQVMQDFQISQGVLEKAADLNVLFDDSFYKKAIAGQ